MKSRKQQLSLTLIVLILMVPLMVSAQYRSKVPSIPGLQARGATTTSFLGIDLSKIEFENSYSMQVSSMGNNSVAMGLLKSSFNYTINPQVSFKGSVGLVHSPFSTINPADDQHSFIGGLSANNLLYSGEFSYRPKDNVLFQIGFSRLPVSTYNQYQSPYYYRPLGY